MFSKGGGNIRTHELNNCGFSLVEVIASIAIIGMVFLAFLSLFSLSSNTAFVSGEKTDLTIVAQGLMEHCLYQEGFAALKNAADGAEHDISYLVPEIYNGRYSAVRVVSLVEGSGSKLLRIIIRTRDKNNPHADAQVSLITLLADV